MLVEVDIREKSWKRQAYRFDHQYKNWKNDEVKTKSLHSKVSKFLKSIPAKFVRNLKILRRLQARSHEYTRENKPIWKTKASKLIRRYKTLENDQAGMKSLQTNVSQFLKSIPANIVSDVQSLSRLKVNYHNRHKVCNVFDQKFDSF